MVKKSIEGLKEAQVAMLKVFKALSPEGAAGIGTKEMTLRAFRWVVTMTHKKTGALKAARRVEVKGLQGIIFTESGHNTRGQNPKGYDVPEQFRGGTHQVYVNFIATQAYAIGRLGIVTMLRNLPK